MIVAPSALATSSTAVVGGRVLAVEDRVHLDDLERPRETRLGDELEREVGLAVGETTANRRAHAGRDLGVENVHVERDVDESRTRDPVERLAHRPLDPDAVDLAHREDANAGLAQQPPLAVVGVPRPDERDPLRIHRR